MKRYLFLFVALLLVVPAYAQTLKPDVFVVGNGNAAVAAAIQAAQSNVKTVLLLEAGGFDISTTTHEMSSGVLADFYKKIDKSSAALDSTQAIKFDKHLANDVLKKWTDSLKNLTVIRDVYCVKAKRVGNGWVFNLSNGKTIRPEVFVAIANQKLNATLKIEALATAWNNLDYGNSIYKTSIAAGGFFKGTVANTFSMYDLLIPNQENLVYVNDASSMLLGQAAGAIAAYAGFFNLKTSASNLKRIQGELIAFRANLMPFSDVSVIDSNWRAIQMVGLTGVLKAQELNGERYFYPENLVSTAEVKQPMKDHFYKAQIWFDDYKNDKITLKATLDLICYVGNKAPEATHKEVAKKWSASYGFKKPFDMDRQVSRREFATLLQDYLPPFNVTVDKAGKIIR